MSQSKFDSAVDTLVNANVVLTLESGAKVSGILVRVDEDLLALKTDRNKELHLVRLGNVVHVFKEIAH